MREMRRKDRQMDRERAEALLARGEYGTLACADAEAGAYAVPLSYVWLEGGVYFHCAMTGHKVDNLQKDERVSFCVVDGVEAVFEGDFTTRYQSALVFGRARRVEQRGEKTRALTALCEKYLPEHRDQVAQSLERAMDKTAVYRIEPEQITGKARR